MTKFTPQCSGRGRSKLACNLPLIDCCTLGTIRRKYEEGCDWSAAVAAVSGGPRRSPPTPSPSRPTRVATARPPACSQLAVGHRRHPDRLHLGRRPTDPGRRHPLRRRHRRWRQRLRRRRRRQRQRGRAEGLRRLPERRQRGWRRADQLRAARRCTRPAPATDDKRASSSSSRTVARAAAPPRKNCLIVSGRCDHEEDRPTWPVLFSFRAQIGVCAGSTTLSGPPAWFVVTTSARTALPPSPMLPRDIVALHATDPATVFLSARAHVDDLQLDHVETALYDDRSVVRLLGMRRTLFVVAAEDVPMTRRRRLVPSPAPRTAAPDRHARGPRRSRPMPMLGSDGRRRARSRHW